MNWKHRAAALVAVPLAIVGLTAVAAQAHSATPHTSAVCNNDGTWSAKFSATNDYSLTSTMSQTGTGLDGSYAKSGQSGDSRMITVTKPVSTTSISFPGSAGKMVWSDGFTQSNINWTSAALPSGCKAPDVKDATASVTTTPGTCTAPGSAAHSETNATLTGGFSTAVGSHTATWTANTGHEFADGSKTRSQSYTVQGQNHELCPVVNPANPTVNQSVCKPRYGGPTQATVILPADGDFTYAVAYAADGSSATVTATLVNGNVNMGTPAGWTATSSTTETTTVALASAHCAARPKVAHLDAVAYPGCSPGHRRLAILSRHGIAHLTRHANASRTRWVLRAHTKAGYLMHNGKHGHGRMVTHVLWVFHAHDTGKCQPTTS